MAGITNPPGFGGARWGEIYWGRYNAFVRAPFSVAGSTDWLPTVNTSVTRTINVATGRGQACGVYEETDAVEQVVFAANSGAGTRFDFLVATFNWTTKTRIFRALQGAVGAYPAINSSTTAVDATKVNRVPGVQYDAIIAAVQVPVGRGIFQPGDIVQDMRPWGSAAGPLVTNATGSLRASMDLPVGAQLQVSGLEIVQRQSNGSLMSTRPKIMVTGTGTQNVVRDSYSTVLLSTAVGYADSGMVYTPGNGRITVTESGYYRPSGMCFWLHNQGNDGWRIAGLAKNGTNLDYSFGQVYPTTANSSMVALPSPLILLGAGDYITMVAHHLSDDPTTLTVNRAKSFLCMTYEGS